MPIPTKHRALSDERFARFGLQACAYIKLVVGSDGGTAYAIHAADGTYLAQYPSLDVACAAVRQNDLEPVRVH